MINRITTIGVFSLLLASGMVVAGTLTADRVLTDELHVKQITVPPPQPPEDLYYSFDSDNGATVTDDSGNGHDGSASACAWTSAGVLGSAGCMAFNGSSGYVNAGYDLDFPTWDAYSVSVWFYCNGNGDYGPGYGWKLVDKTTWYHDWKLGLSPGDGSVSLGMYENGSGMGFGDGSTNYIDNTWHHMVVSRNGAHGEFWVDGTLRCTVENMFAVYSDSPIYIGNSASGDGYQRKCWPGYLDEVQIFDHALASNEVVRLYTIGALVSTSAPTAVLVNTNLTIQGDLAVTGRVTFAAGACLLQPLGDLSCGSYTNRP